MQWSDLGPIKIFKNISIWNSSLNGVASAFQVSTKRYIVHAMQCTMIYVLKRYILQWFMMWRDIYCTVSVTVNPFLLSRLLSPTFHLPKSKVRFPSKNTKYIKKTSQELRMLSRSPSDCRSLLLNLNLNPNRCLSSDCSDCSAIVVLL